MAAHRCWLHVSALTIDWIIMPLMEVVVQALGSKNDMMLWTELVENTSTSHWKNELKYWPEKCYNYNDIYLIKWCHVLFVCKVACWCRCLCRVTGRAKRVKAKAATVPSRFNDKQGCEADGHAVTIARGGCSGLVDQKAGIVLLLLDSMRP